MPLRLPHDELPSINLTSMIDILFLLIIFFMVGTNFGDQEKRLDVSLPSAKVNADSSRVTQRANVVVRANGEVTLDGVPMGLDELTMQLSQRRRAVPNLSVVYGIDKMAVMNGQQLMDLNAAIANSGVRSIGVAAAGASQRR